MRLFLGAQHKSSAFVQIASRRYCKLGQERFQWITTSILSFFKPQPVGFHDFIRSNFTFSFGRISHFHSVKFHDFNRSDFIRRHNLSSKLFQDFQKMLFQRRQVVPVCIPHILRTRSHIIVNQDVSHPDDVAPGGFPHV